MAIFWHSLKSGPQTRDPGTRPVTRDLRHEALGPGTQGTVTQDPETWHTETWDPETKRLWELRQNL